MSEECLDGKMGVTMVLKSACCSLKEIEIIQWLLPRISSDDLHLERGGIEM